MLAETGQRLDALGVNYREGIALLDGNEKLYFKLLDQFLQDADFALLRGAIAQKKPREAFFRAHSLKSMAMNMSLGRVTEPLTALNAQLFAGKLEGALGLCDAFDSSCAAMRKALGEAGI